MSSVQPTLTPVARIQTSTSRVSNPTSRARPMHSLYFASRLIKCRGLSNKRNGQSVACYSEICSSNLPRASIWSCFYPIFRTCPGASLVAGREVINVHVLICSQLACLLCHLLVDSRNNLPIAGQGHSQEIRQTETETLGTFGQNQCRCCTVPLL